eukprot:3016327-Alexandrium_andersonii.AAC.1
MCIRDRSGTDDGRDFPPSPARDRSTEFMVDYRAQSDFCSLLDLEAQPQGCRFWKRKARAFLSGKRPR